MTRTLTTPTDRTAAPNLDRPLRRTLSAVRVARASAGARDAAAGPRAGRDLQSSVPVGTFRPWPGEVDEDEGVPKAPRTTAGRPTGMSTAQLRGRRRGR
jgi:hypothetical protein